MAKDTISEKVSMKGHLIDTGTLSRVLDTITAMGGEFQMDLMELGKTKEDESHVEIDISAPAKSMPAIMEAITRLGAVPLSEKDAVFSPCPKDCNYPENFYSTTNLETWVRISGEWKSVARQRMDAVIVKGADGSITCKKFRELKSGELVACRGGGIITVVPPKDKHSSAFGFMSSDVSSEKSAVLIAKRLAEEMKAIKARGGRIIFVPGPAVVHTGGNMALASIVRKGFVSAVLAGNATAAHDIETSLIGSSLGINCQSGAAMGEGNRNHIAAINSVFGAGSIAAAVEKGVLKRGIFYECVKHKVPFSLAASIRDDGPLPDVETNSVQAQKDYFKLLENADMVIMLASTLHSVAVGNMIPASVRTICVDINPAVVTKLSDRGTSHAIGVVTDVGLFLKELDTNL